MQTVACAKRQVDRQLDRQTDRGRQRGTGRRGMGVTTNWMKIVASCVHATGLNVWPNEAPLAARQCATLPP